ncbi:hypothetical protein PSHT_10477, partial [Puccinia striiformis]
SKNSQAAGVKQWQKETTRTRIERAPLVPCLVKLQVPPEEMVPSSFSIPVSSDDVTVADLESLVLHSRSRKKEHYSSRDVGLGSLMYSSTGPSKAHDSSRRHCFLRTGFKLLLGAEGIAARTPAAACVMFYAAGSSSNVTQPLTSLVGGTTAEAGVGGVVLWEENHSLIGGRQPD